jgi:hypothetical protein
VRPEPPPYATAVMGCRRRLNISRGVVLCPLHPNTLALPALAAAVARPPPARAAERVAPTIIEEQKDRMRRQRPFGPWAAVLLVAVLGLTALHL